jgi:replication factor A1
VPEEGAAAIPRINLNAVKISAIEAIEAGSMLDVMGVVEACEDFSSITRRDGTDAKKRSLTLCDDSNCSIDVTLWGDKAEDPGTELFESVREGQHPVLVLKSVLLWSVLLSLCMCEASASFVGACDTSSAGSCPGMPL